MTTIPASEIVSSTPGVLAANGSALDLNGLMLTNSTRVPTGTVQSFGSSDAVAEFFGATSPEAQFGAVYFGGFDNSNVKPGAMLATQYNKAAVSAYVRGGDFAANNNLAALQGMSGTLSVTIDGSLKTASINLSGATSFTNAAELIAAGLGIVGAQVAAFTGSIATTTLTTTAFSSGEGSLTAGCVVAGAGVTAGTYILQQLTSTETDGSLGGKGTYQVSASQTVGSEALTADSPAVQFDSVSGAFVIYSSTTGATSLITYGSGALATSLLLTAATGAVLSQGAAAAVPAAFMNNVVQQNRNWATFFFSFDPDTSNSITQRLAFAQWVAGQKSYVFVEADSQVSASNTDPDSTCFAAQIKALGYGNVSANWQPSETYLAAFVSGAVASVDFEQAGGRVAFAGRQQSGLTPGVTTDAAATALTDNGYSFYGAYGTANANFLRYQNGFVSGNFTWLDSIINAIWLTNQFQLDLMTFLQNTFSVPYNSAGFGAIQTALGDTIQQGLSFGAYRIGVPVSGTQAAQVKAQAGGLDIGPTLQVQGWYLYIAAPSPTVRQARGSPTIIFFYMDGESIQKLVISTVDLL
jgi:hypothetical protein